MKVFFAGGVAVLALALVLQVGQAQGEKSKIEIKQVMKEARAKGGLMSKVSGGTATDAEKKRLVELFVAMHEGTPPRGERDAWQKATKALVDAAKAAESGDEKAGKSMAKLANCSNCHSKYKGK